MDKLEQLRKEINATDHKILEALSARRELARRVIEEKAESERPLRDPQREQELLARVIAEGRDIGNLTVQRRTGDGLVDAVHDLTFAFVAHAFLPDTRIQR